MTKTTIPITTATRDRLRSIGRRLSTTAAPLTWERLMVWACDALEDAVPPISCPDIDAIAKTARKHIADPEARKDVLTRLESVRQTNAGLRAACKRRGAP